MPAGPPPPITHVVERCSIGPANFLREGLSGEVGLPIFAPCNHQTKEVIQCLIVIPYGVPATWISFPAGFRPKALPNDDNAKGRVPRDAAFLFAFAVLCDCAGAKKFLRRNYALELSAVARYLAVQVSKRERTISIFTMKNRYLRTTMTALMVTAFLGGAAQAADAPAATGAVLVLSLI